MIVERIWTGNAYRNFNYLIACPETGEALAMVSRCRLMNVFGVGTDAGASRAARTAVSARSAS
ncbi:hypothetical protein [Polaromonas hydrogenivorans]|uniref:hypothetical protein n=1 Tax=Polaromonas hydrogenivorans TaxID=335476 RepID=UPI0039EE069B